MPFVSSCTPRSPVARPPLLRCTWTAPSWTRIVIGSRLETMSRRPGVVERLRPAGGASMAGIVMRSAQLERLAAFEALEQREPRLGRLHERAILIGDFPHDGSIVRKRGVERRGVVREVCRAVAALAADERMLRVHRDGTSELGLGGEHGASALHATLL